MYIKFHHFIIYYQYTVRKINSENSSDLYQEHKRLLYFSNTMKSGTFLIWGESIRKLIFLGEFTPKFAELALLKVVEYPRSIMKNTFHLSII